MKRFITAALIALAAAVVQAGGVPQIDRRLLGVGPTQADFFDDTTLQEVRIAINARDWQTLQENFLSNAYYPCDFRWRGLTVRNVGIRSRGTGSRSGTKPGLRVDFDRYTTNQQFLGLKSFVLRNNTQDPSNLHERLTFQLFRRAGFEAPRLAHVRFYVNDTYAGLYTIVEAVDKAFLRRTLNEDEGDLYDYDYPENGVPYYFEDRGSDPASYVPLPFKPETNENNPRTEFIVQLVQAINSGAAFRSAVAPFLDLERFVSYVAVENFVAENDGFLGDFGMNNFYLYRYHNSSRFTMIPWDKSEAFKGGIGYGIFHNLFDVLPERRNRLMAAAIGERDLSELYLNSLLEIGRLVNEVQPSGANWLESEIQRAYEQIRASALEDPVKPFTNEQFEADVAYLRTFARSRAAEVERQIAVIRNAAAARRTWR